MVQITDLCAHSARKLMKSLMLILPRSCVWSVFHVFSHQISSPVGWNLSLPPLIQFTSFWILMILGHLCSVESVQRYLCPSSGSHHTYQFQAQYAWWATAGVSKLIYQGLVCVQVFILISIWFHQLILAFSRFSWGSCLVETNTCTQTGHFWIRLDNTAVANYAS